MDRFQLGTIGFRIFAVDAQGAITVAKDDGWIPLRLRY
jgi:hypothetical protein